MSEGSELLVVDGAQKDREGLRAFFDQRGFVVTAAATGADARRLLAQKFFPVALIDLDVDEPGGGVELIRHVRQVSRPTAIVMITSRGTFDGAVEAFRAGAIDVVEKSAAHVEHLASVVTLAAERFRTGAESDALYREIRGVLDESFKVMLEMSRKVYAHLSLAAMPLKPRVLVVDGEQEFLKELSQLVRKKDWDVSGEVSGGGAMDRGMSAPFDIVASRMELPDLRGSIVLRSIQAQRGEVLGLLYSAADGSGRIDRVEQGQTEDTERPFRGPAHLVERIEALADEMSTRAQERRFIQAFSADHRDYLRRYAELKLKIDRLITD